MADTKELLAQLAEGERKDGPPPAPPAPPAEPTPKPTGRRAIIEFVEDGPRGIVAQVKFEGDWRGADLAVAQRALNREFRYYIVNKRKES